MHFYFVQEPFFYLVRIKIKQNHPGNHIKSDNVSMLVSHLVHLLWCPAHFLSPPQWSSWSCQSGRNKGRNRSRVTQAYRKWWNYFPEERLTPISGFLECHITPSRRQAAPWESVILPSGLSGGAKGGLLEQRVSAWSSCGFISVWRLPVDQTTLTLDLLLTVQLCRPHIYPPARPVGSTLVRADGSCGDKGPSCLLLLYVAGSSLFS